MVSLVLGGTAMCGYYDEIENLRHHIDECYKEPTFKDAENMLLEDRRKMNSKHWAAYHVLSSIYDNPLEDPLDCLEDFLNELNVTLTFDVKQDINIAHYKAAIEAVEELISYLKARRN